MLRVWLGVVRVSGLGKAKEIWLRIVRRSAAKRWPGGRLYVSSGRCTSYGPLLPSCEA